MTAQVVTTTEYRLGTVQKILWDWACTDAGAVSSATTYAYSGRILAVAFIPDGGGTQPTNLYDVTLLDANSHDVLLGQGGDLSNAATVYKVEADKTGAVAESKLTLTIANAGDAKGGVVAVWIG